MTKSRNALGREALSDFGQAAAEDLSGVSLPFLFDSKINVTPSKSTMLALMFVFSFLFSSVNGFSLIVLHTNDNHGRFEETDTHGFMCFPNDAQAGKCFGGMARRATIIKQIRSQEKNVLLLSGGDVLTGTLWYSVYRGNATRDFMNKLGYDAMVSKDINCIKNRAEI